MTILTDSLEQSPSREASRFSASQEIPRNSWNQNVHYRMYKCPPTVPIMLMIVRQETHNKFGYH